MLGCLADQYDISFTQRIEFSDPEGLFSSIPVHFMKRTE